MTKRSTNVARLRRVCPPITGCALILVLAACTTNTPAPIVERGERPIRVAAQEPRPLPPPSPAVGTTATAAPAAVVTGAAPAAPIIERSAPPSGAAAQPGNTPGSAFHVVQRGETLYRIALNNGVSVEALSAWNNLAAGQSIREGQVLRLRPPDGAIASVTPIVNPPLGATVSSGDPRSAPPASVGNPVVAPDAAGMQPTPPAAAAPLKTEPRAQRVPYSDPALAQLQRSDANSPPAVGTGPAAIGAAGAGSTAASAASAAAANASDADVRPGNGVERDGVVWTWPTTGRLASKFNERAPMKGVDIAAKAGTAVVAAAAGKVIYVGKEPRGYGQMIVVRHAKETVSVYFHADKVLVKEEQRVTLGQRIASVSEGNENKMHFEVRRQGRPLDPLTLMPAR